MGIIQSDQNHDLEAVEYDDVTSQQSFGTSRPVSGVMLEMPRSSEQMPNSRIRHMTEPALVRLAQIDLTIVRLVSICARPPLFRFLAVTLSRLGNGGIYAALPVLIFMRLGAGGFDVVAIATFNVVVLHSVYAPLKRHIGRRRPYKVNRDVPSLLDVLDEHSFPSGHIMTLTAALVPVFYVDQDAISYGAGLLVAMGWARVASGHHYPTDVIASAAFAFATSYPLTAIWFG